MHYKLVCLLLSVILLITQCNPRQDSKSKIFSDYLNSQFNEKIPTDIHRFILIPKMACKGCSEEFLKELTALANKQPHNFTFISSNNELIPQHLNIKVKLLKDSKGYLDNLNLNIANVTIIFTESENITAIKSLNLDETQTLKEILFNANKI